MAFYDAQRLPRRDREVLWQRLYQQPMEE